MIYITGDCHAEFGKLGTKHFPEQREMTRDDIVIVCGDFGIWHPDKTEKYWLKWLAQKNFTTVFCDGNHECLHKDTEVLTNKGWMNIVEAYKDNDILIASVNQNTKEISYSKPLNKIETYADKLIHFRGSNYNQCVTEGHDILINEEKHKASECVDLDIRESDFRYNVKPHERVIDIDNEMIEILTSIIMDGTIVDYKKYNENSNKIRIQFHLKKMRKIVYLRNLFDSNNIKYTYTLCDDSTSYIRIYGDDARKLYSMLNCKKEIPQNWNMLNEAQFRYFINALVNTDGSCPSNNYIIWRTTSKNDLDIITELAIRNNYDVSVTKIHSASGYESDIPQYQVSLGRNKRIDHKIKVEYIDYNDYAYCFTMKDGTLITRYDLIPCITGNCFDRLYSDEFPIVDFHGGKAHQIRKNIYHLMRGYIFDFEGKKFFVFGGARSHDIQDGVLNIEDYPSVRDLVKDYNKRTAAGQMLRINHISWWEQEVPSEEEMQRGIKNLQKVKFKVDYVITHTLPQSIITCIYGKNSDIDKTSQYFDRLLDKGLKFNKWMCGHLHQDRDVLGDYHIYYNQIERIL